MRLKLFRATGRAKRISEVVQASGSLVTVTVIGQREMKQRFTVGGLTNIYTPPCRSTAGPVADRGPRRSLFVLRLRTKVTVNGGITHRWVFHKARGLI